MHFYLIFFIFQKIQKYCFVFLNLVKFDAIFVLFMLTSTEWSIVLFHFYLNFKGLVSLFNGISTFVGYLMPKPSLYNSSDIIQPTVGVGRSISIPFPRVFVWKWMWLCNWILNLLTSRPQSITLTIISWGQLSFKKLIKTCITTKTILIIFRYLNILTTGCMTLM